MTHSPELTNAQRAARCESALARYGDEFDIASNLIDLLADVRRWCDRNTQCFADLDRVAYGHYLAELQDERRPS